jgi:hypothetical protein
MDHLWISTNGNIKKAVEHVNENLLRSFKYTFCLKSKLNLSFKCTDQETCNAILETMSVSQTVNWLLMQSVNECKIKSTHPDVFVNADQDLRMERM